MPRTETASKLSRLALAMLLTGAIAVSFGCSRKGGKDPVTPEAVVRAVPAAAKPAPAEAAAAASSPALPGPIHPIYFAFDSDAVSPESLEELERLGDAMLDFPASKVTIYGHTDERGADEYNLALGDMRARAAHRYLTRLGIDAARIRVVTWGEELPAEDGSGDEAWAKNRRDEFDLVLAGTPPSTP